MSGVEPRMIGAGAPERAAPALARAADGPPRRRAAWPALLAGLFAVALGLRLWGFRHGLPYVYNVDENAHFVARAIGMFGHGLDPGYFINPPAFTYFLHVAFWLRWGGAGVQDALAADPGDVYALARALSAVLGAGAVVLLAVAGARLFDRRVGAVAGALLAVAFLPVHYGHFALNDAPALAPVCLALVGVAGVWRRGHGLDFALAGAGIGFAAATKYTAGIVLVCLLVVARDRRGLALALGVAVVAFLVANPYALLSFDDFRAGLTEQSSASRDGGGKLGLVTQNGWLYYLGTLTWGLGWVPLAAAAAGLVGLARRERRVALALALPLALFLAFMGFQDRFFARWLLPAYPLLCLLAGYAAVRLTERRPRWALAAAVVVLCAQGALYSAHNGVVLARDDTRALLRDWMVAHVPAGSKIVLEPIAPDSWAWDVAGPLAATPNGARWIKWPISRARIAGRPGRAGRVEVEDYERTLVPRFVDAYARGGYCWVVTGSTQSGRALAEPGAVPQALAYYARLRERGRRVFALEPWTEEVPFSFDFSFNSYPLRYERPGPAVAVYALRGGACA